MSSIPTLYLQSVQMTEAEPQPKMKPFAVGDSKSKSNCGLLYGSPSSSTFIASTQAVPVPVKSTPKLMLEAVLPTGSSNS